RVNDGGLYMALRYRVARLAVGGKQRLVGKDVDAAREAVGCARQQARRARREDLRPPVPGGAHAEVEVLDHLGRRQRSHAEAVRDAVAQLPQRRLCEGGIELGLAEEHDLEELV